MQDFAHILWMAAPPTVHADQQIGTCHTAESEYNSVASRSASQGLAMNKLAPTSRGQVSVLLAHGNRMDCQLLETALKQCRYPFRIVGSAVNCAQVIESVKKVAPRVVLMSADLQDGPLTGFKALKELQTLSGPPRAIMLLDSPEPPLVINAFRGGAKGIFCRTDPVEHLCKCLYTVSCGQIWANSRDLELILQELALSSPLQIGETRATPALTKREREVVHLVAEGMKNREISRQLKLSEHTIKNYLFRIFDKVGVSSRSELIVYALGQRVER